jgi:hypothetical protein
MPKKASGVRLWRALTLLALIGATLPLRATPADAVDAPWSGAVQVSGGDPSFEPRIAYDREGFAHLVYFAGATQSDWEIYYSNNRTGRWARGRRISDGDAFEKRSPDLAIGRDGHVQVVYQKTTGPGRNQIWHTESPDLGANWIAPVNISNSPRRGFEPAITVDANNGLHAIWIDSRWSDVLQTTYSFRPAGGGWSAPVKIGGNTFERGLSLTTTGAGADVQVHVVYQGRKAGSNSQVDYDIWYVTGVPGRFAPPQNFSRDGGTWSLEPTIVSDGGRNLFLAWDTDANYHDIIFTYSNDRGVSWAPRRIVYSNSTPGLTPSLSYGLLDGRPHAHLAWSEGDTGRRAVLYLAYDPASNSFGTKVERASDNGTLGSTVAASPVGNQVAVTYRNRSLRSVVSTRGASRFIGATIALDAATTPTSTGNLGVTLSDMQGEPIELRYAFDRAPGEQDAWQPLQNSFQAPVPPLESCRRTFNLQLRTSDNRLSQVFTATALIDTAVQAALELRGLAQGGLSLDPAYSAGEIFARVADGGECAGLRALSLDEQAPQAITGEGYAGKLALANPAVEGPREVRLRVEDALGNAATLTRTISVDRTPPEASDGELEILAPEAGLPTPLATLVFSDVELSDNLYEGAWGVLLANEPVSATLATTVTTQPQPARLVARDGALVVENWNVLYGLAQGVGDRTLAGQEIRVRARFLDGAGNASERELSATVTLAEDFRPVERILPALLWR